MKYQKLSSVVLLIGLLCLADTNGQTRRRQKRPSKKITRTNRAKFDLIYDFSVPGETSKIKFVTLLPKTIPDRQKILEIKYSTEPAKVFSKNGNKYAEFVFVDPNESFKLKINVKANLARYDLSTTQRRYKGNPPTDPNINDFLKAERYIEKNDPLIQEIANSIKGINEINTVRRIYNYIIDNLEYGGYNEKDLGAIKTAQHKKGDCSEYSDLFVALCRAKNIPARVITGYTTEFKITPKHAWAEAYLQRYGWVPFDLTLGDKENISIRKKRFHTLEQIYIYFTHIRNDEVIGNGHYYRYWYWGDKIEVKDSIEFK